MAGGVNVRPRVSRTVDVPFPKADAQHDDRGQPAHSQQIDARPDGNKDHECGDAPDV